MKFFWFKNLYFIKKWIFLMFNLMRFINLINAQQKVLDSLLIGKYFTFFI